MRAGGREARRHPRRLVPGRAVGIASMPDGVSARDLVGVAALAGVGFSVSLFIAEPALERAALDQAKVGILVGSVVSAALGSVLLTRSRSGGCDERHDAIGPPPHQPGRGSCL